MRNLAVFVLVLCCSLMAENWPQWRGPNLDGTSGEKGLPVKWSKTENVAWSLAMPSRTGATPIIWGERVFLNVADGDKLELWCLNRENGATLWKQPITGGNRRQNKQNMSSPSPVTDGKNVYVLTGVGALKGFSIDGKELWARDIEKEYGKFGLNWGYGSSPLLHEDSLYVQVLHGMKTKDPSYILRIDKSTGKTIARKERPTKAKVESPDAYTTPTLAKAGNRTELIVSGGDLVTAHDLKTLDEYWRADVLNPTSFAMNRIITSPLFKDGIVYAGSRVKPFVALKPGASGEVGDKNTLWTYDNGPDVPTPVTDGKLLYIVNDKGILYCINAKTGKEVWGGKRIQPAIYSSSPVLADEKLYITNEEGTVTVIKAGRSFEVLAENKMEEYTLSSPAVSEGQIFIRTEKALYCIGKRAGR
ncbi:MAG: PQQ-binding-like beta-propeller repeat protein [Candidatus Solibacter usitatus]|nr:PQQ-binding-like beta-propeller repeat protein [Candidatus Solibacter usitatus]